MNNKALPPLILTLVGVLILIGSLVYRISIDGLQEDCLKHNELVLNGITYECRLKENQE